MGNQSDTLKQDVLVLQNEVRSLQQARQEEQMLLERERLLLKKEKSREQQRKLELQKVDKELEKEKVKERVTDKEAANLSQIKSIVKDIKNFKELHPEENVTNVFNNLHIRRSFVQDEDDESCNTVMRGEENLSESLINDTRGLEASMG